MIKSSNFMVCLMIFASIFLFGCSTSQSKGIKNSQHNTKIADKSAVAPSDNLFDSDDLKNVKTFGIITAMEEEILDLKNMIEIEEIIESAKLQFYVGKFDSDKKIILVKSGIGKVNMASCAQHLIDKFNIDVLINIGVGGAINDKLKVGDLVVAKDLVQYDFDLSAFKYQIGFIPEADKVFFDSDKKILELAEKFNSEQEKNADDKNNIYFGRIASGDRFVCDQKDKDFIRKNFDADCVEMEGASAAQVAFLNNVPFAVIRAISDGANSNAVESYNQSVDSVTKNYLKLIEYVVKNY